MIAIPWVGGSNSGVETAIDRARIVEHLTLLEFAPKLKADAVLLVRLRSLPNVAIDAQRGDRRIVLRCILDRCESH